MSIPNLHLINDEIIVNPNILLKSSCVIISNDIHIDKYKLEIYTNGNIKIINETKKTEYIYINDYIEIIPSLINVYISLFKTICDTNQLDNFIISIQMAKTYFQNVNTEKKIIHNDDFNKDELFQCNKKLRTECDFLEIDITENDQNEMKVRDYFLEYIKENRENNQNTSINNKDILYNELLELYKNSETENKSLKSENKLLKSENKLLKPEIKKEKYIKK